MMDKSVASGNVGPPSHTDPEGTEARKLGLELLVGSNLFRNTNGVIKIHGKEQLVLESKPEQGLLLVTMDLYSETGGHIGHLRRNVLALNQTGQFATEVHRSQGDRPDDYPWVRLSDQRSGALVLEAQVASENRVQIVAGRFYSHRGALVEITPNYCRIGSDITLFGDIVESRGGMVVLASEVPRPFPARP